LNDFIPSFDFTRVFIEPWSSSFSSSFWIVAMGFFVTSACGLVGNYLILRRMALVGDAISHSILPGLAVAFLLSNTRSSVAMFLGALAAGIVTSVLIEVIHRKTRIKQDAAIGITFSTLFAIGVVLISLYADKVDLDQECVLYGEIAFVPLEPAATWFGISLGPEPVARMGGVLLLVGTLILLFYKELLASSFDSGLASSLGINATLVHYSLMAVLSLVVVSAFESAGAILVIAMLIFPGATASLLSSRLPTIMVLSVVGAAISSLLGYHLAVWLDCSVAGAMVVVSFALFVLAWMVGPSQGLLWRWRRQELDAPQAPQDMDKKQLSGDINPKTGKPGLPA
jgi:manganese/zinc/iron transport system permease protein